MNKIATKAAAVTLMASAAIAVSIAAAPAASAVVHPVCATNLYVRAEPGGVIIGTLYASDNFDVDHYSPSGKWVYGHAYGKVHQDGWVQSGWFC